MAKAKFFLIGILIVVLFSSISMAIPTIVVEETELVRVEVDTFDPDADNVTVVYSAPLDENGEWQTDYGDAGNYSTIVTATDGKSLTEEELIIVVKKKNQAPEIEIKDEIIAQETDKITLKPRVFDPNGDKIDLEISEPFDDDLEWETGYDDAGEYTVTLKASDGELETTRVIKIIVNDKNRAPKLTTQLEDDFIEIDEVETFYFSAEATDEDGDEIVYVWELDEEIVSWDKVYVYSGDYDSAGEHILRLIVSDGVDEVIKEWVIDVLDVNRAPVLPEFEEMFLEEGQNLVLSLPESDEDGDSLVYFVEEPIGDDLEWEIDYDEAGEYEIEIEVSDGELKDTALIKIVVIDVDRAPEIEEIEDLEVDENDELVIDLEAVDPDGDDVYFLIYGLPEGAILENDKIIWQPDYDFVAKPGNFMVRLLSRLRLDKYLWQSKKLDLGLTACGRDLCTNQTVNIKINNVNRKPELWVADNIEINETEKLRIKPGAADPDGDVVKFYFSEPLDENGKWQPGYDGAGEYDVIVGATDGRESVEKTVRLIVNNMNREPTLGKIKKRDVNEGEEVWIKMEASDPDDDYLDGWLEGAPEGSSFEEQWFSWTPGYDEVSEKKGFLNDVISNFRFLNRRLSQEKKNYGISFVVSDDDFIVSRLADIVVRNWNRPPEIVNSTPETIQAMVGEKVLLTADAVDFDGDELKYEWDFGFMNGGVENTNKIARRFTSPGEKKITLTVSDGRDTVEKVWNVVVANQRIIESVESVQEPVVQPTFVSYAIEG